MNYQKIAKEIVLNYTNKHIDKTDNVQITLDDVYVVWFCKTLQNWKRRQRNVTSNILQICITRLTCCIATFLTF